MPQHIHGVYYPVGQDTYDLPADWEKHAVSDAMQAREEADLARADAYAYTDAQVQTLSGLDPTVINDMQNLLDQFENGMDATDVAVTALVQDEGSNLKTALSEAFVSTSVDLDQFKRAYRKRIKLSLPFKHPNYVAMRATWGHHYPQCFAIDAVRREIFICYRARSPELVPTGQVVAVYDFDTGAYKSVFAVATTYVSQGAAVVWEGSSRYLYLRTTQTGLGKFDITSLPTNQSQVTPTTIRDVGLAAGDFAYANGVFTVPDPTSPLGPLGPRSRGQFKRVSANNMATVGSFIFDETLAGGNPHKYISSGFPKSQGIADAGGYYLEGVGGYWENGTTVDPYGYQGLRVLTPTGSVLVDALMDPSGMADILTGEGFTVSRIENEGIQLADGGVYTLTVTSSYAVKDNATSPNEGIVIFEEFSDHPDALDFSPAAVGWSTPAISTLEAGIMPRVAGSLRNLITGQALTTLPGIFDYMLAVNQGIFRFHTSVHTVLDTTGVGLPSGAVATVYNGNSHSFFIELTGARPTLLHCYSDGNGGWIQRTILQDTDWTALTITSAVASGYYSPSYRRIGREVMLSGGVGMDGHTAAEFYTVATLPDGFRPSNLQYYPAAVVGTLQSNQARLRVGTDGKIEASLLNATPGAITLTGVRFTLD